jgi:hypothetical protein
MLTARRPEVHVMVAALAVAAAVGGCGKVGSAAGKPDSAVGIADAEGACACPDVRGAPARLELDCVCKSSGAGGACADTLSTFDVAAKCASSLGVLREWGCGRVTYLSTHGETAEGATFDETSGALVGIKRSSFTKGGPCQTNEYEYGETSESCNVQSCKVCGTFDYGNVPSCP